MTTTTRMDPITDDNDVLRAVMAFLDDETDNQELDEMYARFPPPTPPPSDDSGSPSDVESVAEGSVRSTGSSGSREPKTTASSKRMPRVINRSRMRRRHEVLSLREQVIALQERLEVIDKGEEAIAETESERQLRNLRVAAWQSVAESQKEQLEDSEKERDKLRALVKEYKQSIKRVERFLSKQTKPKMLSRAEELLAYTAVDLDPSEGFEEISCNLPTMYLQINGVFKDDRLDAAVTGIRDIKIQNEFTPNMSIETLESRVLPFDVAVTAKAVWRFHQIKAEKMGIAMDEQIEESDDTIRRTFVATLDLPHYRGRARGRMETRRFVERDRVVIVQCAIFDRTERLGGKYLEGFGIRQFHWTVIGPPRNEKLRRSGRAVSQIETFEVGLPFRESHQAGHDPKKDQEEMKNFCYETAHFVLEMERQAVENILMNLSLGI